VPQSPKSIPPEDLSDDTLLDFLPRTDLNGIATPVLGKIPLLARLGKGAMGAVYYGVHPRLKIEVAIKVLQSSLAKKNPDLIERFYREAQSAAKVSSRHLVHVSDVDEECGLFYITMEYVRGISAVEFLKRELKKGKPGLNETDALDIIIAATRGLAAAHEEGIIHRDVKPANIMVPQSKTSDSFDKELSKLADLGLARPEGQDGGLTGAYQAIGTPGFMAPEQIQDASTAGKTADVFSMGATLHALLMAATPFPGSSQVVVFAKTMNEPHARVEAKRPEISLGTIALIDRCLSKDPSRRFTDGTALLDALRICRAKLTDEGAAAPVKLTEGTTVFKKEKSRQTRRVPLADIPLPLALPPQINPDSTVLDPKKSNADKKVEVASSPEPSTGPALPGVPPPDLEMCRLKTYTVFPFDTAEARRRRKDIADALSLPQEITLALPGALQMPFVLIPPGEFLMGSPPSEEFRERDEHNHYARMTRPFYLATTPVTQEQWQSVTGTNTSRGKDAPDSPKRPVERVSWKEINENFFPTIQASATRGWKFRLPSEAEWEYACRAGTETPFHFGLQISTEKLNCKEDVTSGNDWKWVYKQSSGGVLRERGQTSPIHSFPPNAWGLSDMHGNVWEWCEDVYDENFYTNQPCVDPLNLAASEERVLRGGSFNYTARYCRAACRYHSTPDSRNFSFGFRPALVIA